MGTASLTDVEELTVYGLGGRTPVTLTGALDTLSPAVRAAWARCLQPIAGDLDEVESDPVTAHLLTPDEKSSEALVWSASLDQLLPNLTQRITSSKIRSQIGKLIMLHAGAVSHPQTGATIGFVAPGGTGKTTLVRRLASSYGYVTDETVAVTMTGRVLPYPKPLSTRMPEGGPKQEKSPDDLQLLVAPPTMQLRRLVLLARTDDHGPEPVVEELSELEAIAALAPESSSLAALPRPLHALVDLLRSLEPTVRLHYTDGDTVSDLLASWIEQA